jgi:PTH2 family peptidyl-tRNA hydrolase
MDTKQVIVIRKDLKTRRGKEIAQGSHASMAFLTSRIKNDLEGCIEPTCITEFDLKPAEKQWILSSFKKVTLQVESLEALLDIRDKCATIGVECHVITDSGYTEFNGVPTVTCLAIGPDYDDVIDPITSQLKLY